MIKAPQYRRGAGKRFFTCSGGPLDGEQIPLTAVDGQVSTAYFRVATYNDGEAGRYFSGSPRDKIVHWERKQ